MWKKTSRENFSVMLDNENIKTEFSPRVDENGALVKEYISEKYFFELETLV